jgi:hypothetical protein
MPFFLFWPFQTLLTIFFLIISEYLKEYLKVPKSPVTMEDLKNQRQIHSTMKEKKICTHSLFKKYEL